MNQQRYELTLRLFTQAALAFMALAMFYLMTGCNPYAEIPATAIPTPSATATKSGVAEWAYPITPTPRPSCVVVTGVPAGQLNIRSGAGTSFAVIGLLHEGDTLTLTGTQRGAWLEVIADNLTGWVNGKYCEAQR